MGQQFLDSTEGFSWGDPPRKILKSRCPERQPETNSDVGGGAKRGGQTIRAAPPLPPLVIKGWGKRPPCPPRSGGPDGVPAAILAWVTSDVGSTVFPELTKHNMD